MSCGKFSNKCILFLNYSNMILYTYEKAAECNLLEYRHLNNECKYIIEKFKYCPKCGKKNPGWSYIRAKIKRLKDWHTEQRRQIWIKED